MRYLVLALLVPALSGCAAALTAEAASGIVVRAGAGSVARGAAISRVAVANDLTALGAQRLTQAGAGGILERSLAQLTANGTRSVTLSVNRSGIISSGTEELARIAPGTGELTIGRLFGGRRVIGGISSESMIVENGMNVARLRGFLPTSRLVIKAPTRSRMPASVIDRPLLVRVRGIDHNGRYRISVSGSPEFSVDAAFLSLALLPAAIADSACLNDEGGMVALSDGRTLSFDSCEANGEIIAINDRGHQTLVHRDDVDGFLDPNVVRSM